MHQSVKQARGDEWVRDVYQHHWDRHVDYLDVLRHVYNLGHDDAAVAPMHPMTRPQ